MKLKTERAREILPSASELDAFEHGKIESFALLEEAEEVEWGEGEEGEAREERGGVGEECGAAGGVERGGGCGG